MNLDRLFLVGHDAELAAQDIFTNRVSERAAFDTSWRSHQDSWAQDAVSLVCNTREARRNVVAFYGLGGVGKTTLSRALEREYLEHDQDADRAATARVDFGDVANHHLESVVLSLRAVLGGRSAQWPAFDLGWSVYWEKAHPGEPMRETINRSSVWRRASQRLSLGDQMQDAVEDLLNSPGGVLGIFMGSARAVGHSVREAVLERQVLRECPFFGAVVEEEDAGKMLRFLPALLAWDLARLQQESGGPTLVVFFDTWETVQAAELRAGTMEEDLSRMVYLMPNVLFVVTGRDRLRWGDGEAVHALLWGGPDRWPGLAKGAQDEPRQHLVGGLSPEDGDRYLRGRLLRNGHPAIPPEVREAIIAGSDGLPLYLDLAATRYDQLASAGETPESAEFGQPLAEVVLRVMRDLDPEQRALLRCASVLQRFDRELLQAGVPTAGDAAVNRFLERSVVEHIDQTWAPYSLHECLREAVRPSDIAADRWSDAEWCRAINRVLAVLAARMKPEIEHVGVLPLPHLKHDFVEAWHLSVQLGSVPDWVLVLAARLQTRGALDSLTEAEKLTPAESSLHAAAVGLGAIGRRVELGHARTAHLLRQCLASDELTDAARDFLTIWLCWQLEGLGERARADALRLGIAERDGPFAGWARHAVGRADWVQGRLSRANSWRFDEDDVLQRILGLGIRSNVALILGRFAEAEELARLRLSLSEELDAAEMIAHALRSLAQVTCWTGTLEDSVWQEAAALYARLGNRISGAEALVTGAVQVAGRDTEAFDERMTAARELNGLTGGVETAHIFHALSQGDVASARQFRASLLSRNAGTSAYRNWDAVTGWWLSAVSGRPERGVDVPVDWVHGQNDAQARWVDVLQRRLSS